MSSSHNLRIAHRRSSSPGYPDHLIVEAVLSVNSARSLEDFAQAASERLRALLNVGVAFVQIQTRDPRNEKANSTGTNGWRSGRSGTRDNHPIGLRAPLRLPHAELPRHPMWPFFQQFASGGRLYGWLAVPLRTKRDEYLGALHVSGKRMEREPVDFDEADEAALELFARLAVPSLETLLLEASSREANAVHQESEARLDLYHSIFSNSPEAIALIDARGVYLEQNRAHQKLLGYADDELWDRTPAVHMGESQFQQVAQELSGKGRFHGVVESRKRDGEPVDLDLNAFPIRDKDGEVRCFVGVKRDVTEKLRTERELRIRERQQAAVAELGQQALTGMQLDELMQRACVAVTQLLEIEFAKVLELQPDQNMFLRAGVGWQEGLVGKIKVPTGLDSQAGYTLRCSEPVVVPDLRTETRFNGPALLRNHGVVSGMSVIISGKSGPWGVLGAHTASPRTFSRDDVNFLQAVANVLAAAIERRSAEEAIEQREAELMLALQVSGMAAWHWDLKTNCIVWSKGSARIFGVDFEGLADIDQWLLRLHPDDRQTVWQELRTVIAGEREYDVEFRTVWPDGSMRWIVSRGRVFHDDEGSPARMLGISVDVTQRKLADQRLHESDLRFRQTQKAANIAAYDWDVTTGQVNWSERLPGLAGVAPDNLFSQWTAALHPDDRDRVLQAMFEAVDRGGEFDIECRLLVPSGDAVWIVSRGHVRTDDGRPHVLGIVMDVTARKHAEQMLQRSEKLAMVGRLAASIAHEINNPLESVTNLLYLIEHYSKADPSAREYAKLAQQELGRVSNIARQTLGFYRESTLPMRVNLAEVTESVLQLYSRKIDQKSLSIVRRFDEVPAIEVFPGEMRQVISNLLMNAVEASPEKGRIVVRLRPARDAGCAGVRLTIADEGHGIRAEHRKKIFEPFFTTKGEKGTGLGLWVTSGIVQKHGGTIRVRSNISPHRHGTVFSIFLPDGAPAVDEESELRRSRLLSETSAD